MQSISVLCCAEAGGLSMLPVGLFFTRMVTYADSYQCAS